MTSFLTGGLGGIGSSATSRETAILREIDSSKKSYANKDFVKNIAWLNQSVDTLSLYTQKLQKGVDQANMNALEQLQGIWGDLFILFAGLEPTGIDVGDVKYIIQGIGAMFGINPDTPFPLNIFNAVEHMFMTYMVPLEQFTDVIFDAILAWAEDFGFSPEFMQTVRDLRDAINLLGTNVTELFNTIGELLTALGGSGWDMGPLGDLWDGLMDLFGAINTSALKPVIAMLADLGIPFIQALTAIVNGGNAFLGFISGDQIKKLGDNVAPDPSNQTTTWSVGASSVTGWRHDSAISPSGSSKGSLTSQGTGVAKRVETQQIFKATPGTKFVFTGKMRWSGIPTGSNDAQIQMVWFNGQTEISSYSIAIQAGHGANSVGFVNLPQDEVTVPANVDGFKVAARIGTGMTTGQIWVAGLDARRSGGLPSSIIDGLFGGDGSILGRLIPQLSPDKLPLLSLSALTTAESNWLVSPKFMTAASIEDNPWWHWDATVSHTADTGGSAKVEADGTPKAMRSNEIIVKPGQKMNSSIYVKWEDYNGSGIPIALQVLEFNGTGTDAKKIREVEIANFKPATENGGWFKISGAYEVPELVEGLTVDGIRLRILIKDLAMAGTFWFDDAESKKSSIFQMDWVQGLGGALSTVNAQWQLLVDTITNGLTGVSNIYNQITDLANALLAIPLKNILGILGPATAGGSIMEIINHLVGGFLGLGSTNNASLSDIANSANTVSNNASNGATAWDFLTLRNNEPMFTGLLPSGKSNLNLSQIGRGTASNNFAVTQAVSAISNLRIEKSDDIRVVSWLGYGVTNITAMYVNIWKNNPANGTRSLVHHSPNIIGSIDSSGTQALPPWQFYDIDEDDAIHVEPGEEYGREIVVVGTGTHYVVGEDIWLRPHPRATIMGFGETRNNTTNYDPPPSSIVKASVVTTTKVPWIEWAPSSGYQPTNNHAPVEHNLSGTGTIPRPDWANYIDIIVCGDGAGAHAGGLIGAYGESGGPGEIVAVTLIIGTDFDEDDDIISYTFGPGGIGGPGSGAAGAGSSVTLGTNTITAATGAPGDGYGNAARAVGIGPGKFTFKGIEFIGGLNQNVNGANGTFPGGGGAGGGWIGLPDGGNGGAGGGKIRFRQVALPGEMVIGDITPPTAPTITDVIATYSAISFKATGSVDDSGTVANFKFFVDGVLQNPIPQSSNQYSVSGLLSNTDYDLSATALDANGNESAMSAVYTASTLEYIPEGTPMSAEKKAGIDAIILEHMTSSACTLATDGPHGYYEQAYGKRNEFPGAEDVTLDDHFRVGSISKILTGSVILMLIDQGLLNLDDKLEQFVPGVPNGNDITIEMMLAMRSGVFEYLADPMVGIIFMLFPWWGFSEQAAINIIKTKSTAPPGSAWAYANSNYILLGAVAAAVKGKPVKEVIQEMILDPLELTETIWPPDFQMPQPAPLGYRPGLIPGTFQDGTWLTPELFGAAGCYVSTVRNILSLAKAIRDGSLYSPAMQTLRETKIWGEPWTNDDQLNEFGYGLAYFSLGKWLGHAGTCPGGEGVCYYLPDGTVLAILENKQTPIVETEVVHMFLIGLFLDPTSMDQPESYLHWPEGTV